jgi:probable HAF family extracellular repeat protein
MAADAEFQGLGGQGEAFLSDDGTRYAVGQQMRAVPPSTISSEVTLLGQRVTSISADGSAFALTSEVFGTWYWTQATGLVPVPDAEGFQWSMSPRISRDGTVVYGNAMSASMDFRAFRAVPGSSPMVDIGTLGGADAYPAGASADGSVIVGRSETPSGEVHAFRWTAAGMSDLGTLGGDTSSALFVSSDGSVVVGTSTTASGDGKVFRWTVTGGLSALPDLGWATTTATAMSEDGAVVAGWARDESGATRAFRWTAGGGTVDLGEAYEDGSARLHMSVDGGIVFGEYLDGTGRKRAFRWTEAEGRSDIGDLGPVGGLAVVTRDGRFAAGRLTLPGSGAAGRAFVWSSALGMVEVDRLLATEDLITGEFIHFETVIAAASSGDELSLIGTGPPVWEPWSPFWGWRARFTMPGAEVALPPQVVTKPAVLGGGKSVELFAEVVADGGATVGERGFEIEGVRLSAGSGTGSFSIVLDAVLAADTTYEVRGYAVNEVGTHYGAAVQFSTPAGPTLDWIDVGNPVVAGSTVAYTFEDAYLVSAGGADMWGARDEFRFGFEAIDGDAELVVNVAELVAAHPWARAGISFRASSADDAPHVSLIATAGNGVDLHWRATAGGQTQRLGQQPTGAFTPVYLKLERKGNTYSASRSDDGSTWTPVGEASVVLPSVAQAGLIACAISTTTSATVEFARYYSRGITNAPVAQVEITGDLEFGDVESGVVSVRQAILTNTGDVELDVSALELPVGFSASFAGTLNVGQSVTVPVTFAPTALDDYSGLFVVRDEVGSAVDAVPISGRGTDLVDPLTWVDIGVPTVAGHQTRNALQSRYRISAGGVDMWAGSDQGRFGYVEVSGDFEAVIRVESVEGPHPWSRVGLSFRASVGVGSAQVALIATENNGIDLQWRAEDGGPTANVGGQPGQAGDPRFLKLTRIGNRFHGYWSDDGETWVLRGVVDVVLPERALVGLISSAISSVAPTRSTIDASGLFAAIDAVPTEASVILSGLERTYDGTAQPVAVATVPAGLAVTVTYDDGPTVPVEAGDYRVDVVVSENGYTGGASGTLTIAKRTQTIDFPAMPSTTFGAGAAALGASASSQLPVEYTIVSGPGVVDGATVLVSGAGAVVVRASQPGDANNLPATPVDRTLIVGKAQATVSLGSLQAVFGGVPRAATAQTTPAGLAVEFTYDGGTAVPVNAGSYAVVATVVDANFEGAASGTFAIARAPQSIEFAPFPDVPFGAPARVLAGSASSGLPVEFSLVSGPGAVAGNLLATTGVGVVTVRATQAGNGNFEPAIAVERSFLVSEAAAAVEITGATVVFDGTPKAVLVTTNPPGLAVQVTYDGATTLPSAIGTYLVEATVTDPNYTGVASASLTIVPDARLVNLSSRGIVGSGADVVIAGFVVDGTGSKRLLLRGVGPTLEAWGVDGVLERPVLRLMRASEELEVNQGWTTNPDATSIAGFGVEVGAFDLLPGGNDSALLVELPRGEYTAQLSGAGTTTGVGLIEIYDLEPSASARLVNLSTRAKVLTGSGVLIPGYVIDGVAPRKVLIRAVGPTIALPEYGGVVGTLENPRVDVYRRVGVDEQVHVAENDDWGSAPDRVDLLATTASVGAFPLQDDSTDAALVLDLEPGVYTVQVSGVGGGTGVALVEIYEVLP